MNLKISWSVLIGLIFIFLLFWKIPFKGEVPFPGNLLTGRFFPWNTVEWEGYPTGVPYKEFIVADAVRQTYPFRKLAIEELNKGNIPWWNPYVMSGSPLLGNMQSAAFYPLNFIFFITSFNIGWVILVVVQPLLAFCFMYLFLRSLNLTPSASLLGSLSFALSGYMLVWLELNTVGHAALWLPLMLWGILKTKESYKYFAVFIFGLICSVFANHIQTSLYSLIFSCLFFIYNFINLSDSKNQKFKYFFTFFVSILAVFLVTSIQLLPAIDLLRLSPRFGTNTDIFNQFLLPWSHLVTFLIPNYFGNPATNNYFGKDYGEFMAFMGIVPIVLVVSFLFKKTKTKLEKFFLISLIIGFLLTLKNPFAYLPQILRIPILESSAPSRALFLIQFLIAILASYGFDNLQKQTKKTTIYILGTLFGLFTILILLALIPWQFSQDIVVQSQSKVSLRNSLFPLLELGMIAFAFIVYHYNKKRFFLPILLVSMFLGLSTFMNKYLPFAPIEFMYPKNPVFTYIDSIKTYDRFWGDYTASVTSNVWMNDELFGIEGYDALYIGRYGTLLEYANTNGENAVAKRSDANLASNQDNDYRRRLQDILGVKYILDKSDYPQSHWDPDFDKFPQDRYELTWQEGKFKVYKNLNSFPRAMLVPTYLELNSESEILSNLFDPNIDLKKIVILEEKPRSSIWQKKPPQFDSVNLSNLDLVGEVNIIDYLPNFVKLKVNTPKEQILVFSDVYHPSWQAFIDGNWVPIMRSNYVFRGVLMPPGEHIVEMKVNQNFLEYLSYKNE